MDVFITKFNTEVDTVFFLYNYHARKLMKPLINNKAAIYFNLDEIIALVRKRIIDLRIVQILSIICNTQIRDKLLTAVQRNMVLKLKLHTDFIDWMSK